MHTLFQNPICSVASPEQVVDQLEVTILSSWKCYSEQEQKEQEQEERCWRIYLEVLLLELALLAIGQFEKMKIESRRSFEIFYCVICSFMKALSLIIARKSTFLLSQRRNGILPRRHSSPSSESPNHQCSLVPHTRGLCTLREDECPRRAGASGLVGIRSCAASAFGGAF